MISPSATLPPYVNTQPPYVSTQPLYVNTQTPLRLNQLRDNARNSRDTVYSVGSALALGMYTC